MGLIYILWMVSFLIIIILLYEFLYTHLNQNSKLPIKDGAAIIIIKRNWYDFFAIYFQGISWLIRYLKKYHAIEIFMDINPKKFVKVINDPRYTRFYVFGHGFIGGLDFPKKGGVIKLLYYKDINTTKNATFVGQYHCNNGKGISLAKKLNAENSDINTRRRWSILNYAHFLKMYFCSKKI